MAKIEVPTAENPNSLKDVFERYYKIVQILRKECPWDREQSNESIAPLLIEESYELIESIHKKNDKDFMKELGDVLLHIVMHSIISEEREAFNLIDVINGNAHKMVTRHPHVFGEITAENGDEVTKNWEQIKMKEGQNSVLDGVPQSMPSLLRAERIQHKASRMGFDWDNVEDVWAKVYEEFDEFKVEVEKGDQKASEEEFGDLIFALVNLARYKGIVAEDSLMKTNEKFTRRFQYIERKAKENNRNLQDMTLQEMDVFWDEAKDLGL